MINQPWECPRCKRINAPFNPTCFCNPENDLSLSEKDLLEKIKKPLYTFDEDDKPVVRLKALQKQNMSEAEFKAMYAQNPEPTDERHK